MRGFIKPRINITIVDMLTHHAYLCVGTSKDSIFSHIQDKLQIKILGNPDFFDESYETFTIDDARQVKSLHATRPVSESGKKIFVLRMNGITVEAQNALLKLLEEPAEYAHFFIIIPSAHLLLPTVRSRMQEFDANGKGKKQNGNNKNKAQGGNGELIKTVEKFVTLSKAKRLEEVKKLIDDISKEKKTKQDAIDLLNAIEEVVYQKGVEKNKKTLEGIELARTYMNDRAPSLKMLLEYALLQM